MADKLPKDQIELKAKLEGNAQKNNLVDCLRFLSVTEGLRHDAKYGVDGDVGKVISAEPISKNIQTRLYAWYDAVSANDRYQEVDLPSIKSSDKWLQKHNASVVAETKISGDSSKMDSPTPSIASGRQ